MYFLRNLFLILYFHKSKTAMSMTSKQECPECSGPIVGRNFLVESIAAVVFSRELSMSNRYNGDENNHDGDADDNGCCIVFKRRLSEETECETDCKLIQMQRFATRKML